MAKKKAKNSKETDSLTANLPQQIKVTLPWIEIPGCREAGDLAGDYILRRFFANDVSAVWKVDFDTVCGYYGMHLQLRKDSDGVCVLGLTLFGGLAQVAWTRKRDIDFSKPIELTLFGAEDQAGEWPVQLALESICSEVQESVPRLMATSASSIEECDCPGWAWGTVRLQYSGITNIGCDDCGSCAEFSYPIIVDGQVPAPMPQTPCSWFAYQWPLPACWCVAFYDYIQIYTIPSQDGCTMDVGCIVSAGESRLDAFGHFEAIPLEEFIGQTRFTLPLHYPPGGPLACDVDGSTVVLELLSPSLDPDVDIYCRQNEPGTCVTELVSLPPSPWRLCTIDIRCCTPMCTAPGRSPAVPGTSSTCVTCGPAGGGPTIDVRTGKVGVSLPVPSSGSGGISGDFSVSGCVGVGCTPATFSVIREYVTEVNETEAIVHKCDGSKRYYVCKDAVTGSTNQLATTEARSCRILTVPSRKRSLTDSFTNMTLQVL